MGACLQLTVPTTRSISACRGEKRGTSAPNRAMSYRADETLMYSMPQQAVTNGYCQREFFRAHPRPFETIRWKNPVASSRRVAIPGTTSSSDAISVGLHLERALLPDVGEADHQRECEEGHRDVTGPPEVSEQDCPRVDEDRLDIEHDEEQGDHVELHAEALAGATDGVRPALERRRLHRAGATRPEERSGAYQQGGQGTRHDECNGEREIGLKRGHSSLLPKGQAWGRVLFHPS